MEFCEGMKTGLAKATSGASFESSDVGTRSDDDEKEVPESPSRAQLR